MSEAAKRLRQWLARPGFDKGMFADGMAFPLELDAALAAERKATVERIRAAALAKRKQWGAEGLPASLEAILDAEAVR